MKKVFALLLFCIFLSSCSWQEYFIINNNSDSSILTYKLTNTDRFPIFESYTDAYNTTNSENIDWNKKITLEDKDTSALGLQFTLPPKSLFILGHLSNDNYTKQDQYFINGRVFNFQSMEIKKKDGTSNISRENFDSFFKKKNGSIQYEVN